MKKLVKILSLCLVLTMALTLFTACGGKEEKNTLVMATSPDFPPFEYLEGSEVVGIEVDIMKKIADKMGKELVIEQMDFDSVIPGVQAGKFDVGVSGITATEERKQNMDFSDTYFVAAQAIVVTPDSPITCKADLTGKKISVQTGTTAEDYCMSEGYEVSAFTANNDAAAALTSGKVDAWVVDNEVAVALAAQQGLTVLDEAMTTEPYAFAFKKGADADMIAAFNEVINGMIADGSMEALFDQYGVLYVGP
mgnify:CR=1 FL=1